jgi:phospholipid/cholesterol/gamma-HCH transport system substrate-binding protein
MPRAFRLGVFIVAALLILAAGIFLIGNKQFLFSRTFSLRAGFENVGGLSGGAEVRVGGIHEGTVRTIKLPTRPGEKVTVVMDLAAWTRDIIKKDSIAWIKTEGLLGDKYVEISFGSKEAEKVKDGDILEGQPPVDISDMIKKTDQILDTTKDAVQNVDQITGNLKSITAEISEGKGTVGALIRDKKIYEEADAAAAQAQAGATAFQENMEALKHNLLLRGFFKKRGFEDSSELTKNEIPQLPAEPSMKEFAYDAKRIFGKPDTAKLRNQKLLNEAGKFLEENKFGWAVVAAYTGMKGDTDKERALTEARAMVVRDYLAENFRLDDTHIKTMGAGKTEQVSESKIRILVYPVGSTPPPGQNQSH